MGKVGFVGVMRVEKERARCRSVVAEELHLRGTGQSSSQRRLG